MAEEADEMLDDIFVLCRAFESTWSGHGGERIQSEQAVIATLASVGVESLPAVQQLVSALKAFIYASPAEVGEWFGSDDRSDSETKRRTASTVRALQEALASNRWTQEDSRKLGQTVYRMRCAVVHPSLDTENSLVGPVLPRLRDALVELTVAAAAVRFGLSLEDAHEQFDIHRKR